MDRRNFLKKLGIGLGAAAAATVPSIAKDRKGEYAIEDMFVQHNGNGNLFYLKEGCWLDDEIKKTLGKRYVDKKYFSHYLPMYGLPLPMKEKYEKDDFEPFVLLLKDRGRFSCFCDDSFRRNDDTFGKSILRLFKDDKAGYYRFEMFEARNPNLD